MGRPEKVPVANLSTILPVQEFLVSQTNPLLEVHLRSPAQIKQARTVHQFARSPIRFGFVPNDFSAEANYPLNHRSQFFNGEITAEPDVDDFFLTVFLHQKNEGPCQIIGVKEFPLRLAGAPARHRRLRARFRLMEM